MLLQVLELISKAFKKLNINSKKKSITAGKQILRREKLQADET